MEVKLHVVHAGNNAIPVGLPGQLHVRCVQRFPHEEADVLPVRYSLTNSIILVVSSRTRGHILETFLRHFRKI